MTSTLKAWAGVHATRAGALVVGGSAAVTALLGNVHLASFGPAHFLAPVSTSLLLPVVGGVGAAMACDNGVHLPLRRPGRAMAARGLWAATWVLSAAVLLSIASRLGTDPPSAAAVGRNVLLAACLALGVQVLRAEELIWAPPVVLALTSMLFGAHQTGSGEGLYWWGVTLDPAVSRRQVLIVGVALVAICVAHALRRPRSGA